MTGVSYGTAPRRGGLPWWAWVLIAVWLLPVLLVAVTTLSVMSSHPRRSPEQAHHRVGWAVQAAERRDFALLCRLDREPRDCEAALAAGAADTVPAGTRPRVELRKYRDQEVWLFLVTGRDGRGRPYESEVAVRRDGLLVNAVFWTGSRVDPAELS